MLGVAAACTGDTDGEGPRHATPETATPAITTATPVRTPATPLPTEFRVAFINLHSPLLQDLGDSAVETTFRQRLKMIIDELRSFDPDVVGFNEWFWTPAFPDVATTLGRELSMVPCWQRANPWYPGQTREQSNALVTQVGFEEGELILVRNTYLSERTCERYALHPLTSESGEGRIGVHLLIKGPSSFGGNGEIDVFITHLKGGSDAIRAEQAADFARWVVAKRGSGPSIVMVGQDDPASASNYDTYRAIGLRDVFASEDVMTCCRVSVVGEQQPMTARNDYLMYDRMQVISADVLGAEPLKMDDGQLLYASDHLGIKATFRVPPERPGPIP
jgi:endonuclease/exonuclease/phosphatase family metal-dependent hydrolase